METLADKISSQTGIDKEKSLVIVGIVANDLKSKFPTALHSEIDNVMGGGKFGDTYREKAEELKEKVEDAAKQFGAKAEHTFNEIREKLNELFSTKKK